MKRSGGVRGVARRKVRLWVLATVAPVVIFLIFAVGVLAVLGGSGRGDCPPSGGGAPDVDIGDVGGKAKDSIPPKALKLYLAAAKKYNIDWTFLAAVGGQECDHGRCATKNAVNGSGCIGFMQLGVGGDCGFFFEQNKQDGNGDGKKDPTNDADNVFTAAYGLRFAKKAPPTGGSEAAYHQAACNYYGACFFIIPYADQVMARAKGYGFPAAKGETDDVSIIPVGDGSATPQCGGDAGTVDAGPADFKTAKRISTPGKMVLMPAWATAKGYSGPAIFGGRAKIDSRVMPNLLWMLKKYKLRVHDCLASGHNTHGNGSGCDIVPEDDPLPQPGKMTPGWKNVEQLANDLGWKQPGPGYPGGYACNSGMPFAPAIYIVCYNGDSNHGDPKHITGSCACPHLHLSWKAAEQAAPVALPSPPAWVYVFPQAEDGGDGGSEDESSTEATVRGRRGDDDQDQEDDAMTAQATAGPERGS